MFTRQNAVSKDPNLEWVKHLLEACWHGLCFPEGMKLAPGKIAIACVWLTAAAAGAWKLYQYELTPGSASVTSERWPAGSQIKLAHDGPTLLFFAHPQCPCTRASVEELNRLMARANGTIECRALFFQPPDYPAEWSHGSLWNSAAAIPGVTAQVDPDGEEARRFGAETSGYVVLYSRDGRLLFRGGITAARGHAGDNPGADAIAAIANGEAAARHETPVFGCSLLGQCPASAKN